MLWEDWLAGQVLHTVDVSFFERLQLGFWLRLFEHRRFDWRLWLRFDAHGSFDWRPVLLLLDYLLQLSKLALGRHRDKPRDLLCNCSLQRHLSTGTLLEFVIVVALALLVFRRWKHVL